MKKYYQTIWLIILTTIILIAAFSKDETEKTKVEYIYENTDYESYYRGYYEGYDKGLRNGTFDCRLENAAQWMADKYQWEKCLEESK